MPLILRIVLFQVRLDILQIIAKMQVESSLHFYKHLIGWFQIRFRIDIDNNALNNEYK